MLEAEAQATTKLATARALRDRAAASVEEVVALVAGRPDRAAAEHTLEEADRLAAAHDEADGAARRAANAAAAADAALADVRRREQQARRTYDDARERLSALVAAGLPARQDHLVDDWRALAQWAGTEHATVTAQIEAAEAERRLLDECGTARRAELIAALAAVPGASQASRTSPVSAAGSPPRWSTPAPRSAPSNGSGHAPPRHVSRRQAGTSAPRSPACSATCCAPISSSAGCSTRRSAIWSGGPTSGWAS